MSLDLILIFSEFNLKMSKALNQKIYEFEDFRLDAAHLLLYQNGREIPLAPKVVETLLVLVENRGRVLSTGEMMEKVWVGSIVEENNLAQNLLRLRKTLGRAKDGKPFIETLRRRGYRFVPEVSIVEFGEEVLNPVAEQIADEISVRSDLNHLQDKELSENETQNANLIGGVTLDLPEKPVPDLQNISAKPRSKPLSRTVLVFGSVLLAFSLISLIFILLPGFALRSGWQTKSSKEPNLRRLTESGNLHGAEISPDGNSLLYVLREGKNYSLRLKNISTESEIVIIPLTENALISPRFSPDGNFIYYSTLEHEGSIYQIPIFGGEARRFAVNIWSVFSVSPDGRQVAFPRSTRPGENSFIVVAETDGSGERIAATRTDPDFYISWGPAPVWSPDGEHLTVVTGRHGSEEMRLVEVNLQTGEERELKTQDVWEVIDFIGWVNREELLIAARKKGEIPLQIWSVKFPEGRAERITNDFNDYLHFSLSKDTGKIVVMQGVENLHLWLFDKQTGASRQITFGTSRADGRFGLAFAPDGRIVFTARDKNNYDIFSVNADGGDLRQLTKNAGRRNTEAVVSPDNQFIAFTSDRAGGPHLWRMNMNGSDARRLTTVSDDKEKAEAAPYFSPDGQWIYYCFSQAGKASIRKVPSFGGESVEVIQADKNPFEPVASPDGKRLAHAVYNDEAVQPWQISVISLENSSEKAKFFNFPAFRHRPRWTLDSSSLISIDDSVDSNLWETNLESGERKQITNFTNERVTRFDISPDGRFFVLSRGNYFTDAVLIER